MVDTGAGGDTWDGVGDSDAGVGDTRGGGRAAARPTLGRATRAAAPGTGPHMAPRLQVGFCDVRRVDALSFQKLGDRDRAVVVGIHLDKLRRHRVGVIVGIKDGMALGSELGLVLGKSSPYSAQTLSLLRLHFAGREQSLKCSCTVQNLAPNPSQIAKAS